jgi:hypothetical protein
MGQQAVVERLFTLFVDAPPFSPIAAETHQVARGGLS